MVGLQSFFRRSGLTRNRASFIWKLAVIRLIHYYFSHSMMNEIPVSLWHIYLISDLSTVIFHFAVGIKRNLIYQCKIKTFSAVCNSCNISCKTNSWIVICILSDSATDSILWGNFWFRFGNLYSGFICQAIFSRIFSKLGATKITVIFIATCSQSITDFIEKAVTGISDTTYNIKWTVSACFPTFCGMLRIRFTENSATANGWSCSYNIFHKSRGSGYHLECRTGCGLLKSGMIIHRFSIWLIHQKTCQIIRISIAQTIVVITGVRYKCQNITCLYICNNHGTCTRI